jgi:hypothetical protein
MRNDCRLEVEQLIDGDEKILEPSLRGLKKPGPKRPIPDGPVIEVIQQQHLLGAWSLVELFQELL